MSIGTTVVTVVLCVAIYFIAQKVEGYDNVDYLNMHINQYNYDLDNYMNGDISKQNQKPYRFVRPQDTKTVMTNKKKLPHIVDNSEGMIEDLKTMRDNRKDVEYDNRLDHMVQNFDFTPDNLRYLNYNKNNSKQYENLVMNDMDENVNLVGGYLEDRQ